MRKNTLQEDFDDLVGAFQQSNIRIVKLQSVRRDLVKALEAYKERGDWFSEEHWFIDFSDAEELAEAAIERAKEK